MGAAEILELVAQGISLAQTLIAENRAATADELAALVATAQTKDAAAVAADDVAQSGAQG